MKASDICGTYEEDQIWFNGERRTICSYWDLDTPGLCRNNLYNVCRVKLIKSGITDGWLLTFMEDMGCVLVKENL